MKLSLASKNALSYFLIFVISTSLIVFFVLKNSSREILQASEQNLLHSAELVKLRLTEFVDELSYDIRYLSQNPLLLEYLQDGSNSNKELLTKEYLSFIESNPNVSQLRFIGLADAGKELIRVERKLDRCTVIADSLLQSKGDRDYFVTTTQLPEDSIYISEIDLNKEFGVISLPYTPTLRMAYPIYFSGKLRGIVIINSDLNPLYNEIQAIAGSNSYLSLVNSKSHYVLHQDTLKAFSFEFGRDSDFKDNFGAEPERLHSMHQGEVFRNGDFLYSIANAYFPRPGYGIYILLSADRNVLLQGYFKWRRSIFLVVLILSLFSLLFSLILLRRQVGELNSITEQIDIFSSSLRPTRLPDQRNDEIGVLARSFNRMSEVINSNIDDLRAEKERAEKAVREKQEFLENMSHEIRNPIQNILGVSEILSKNDILPHQVSLIDSIRLSTTYLESLSNDILDYKKIVDGHVQLNKDWVDIHKQTQSFKNLFAYAAMIKGVDFNVETDKGLEQKLYYYDTTRLNQVLTNLIINAIKFTPSKGAVDLKLALLEPVDNEVDIIRFEVIDNGVGIPAQDLESISKRYYSEGVSDSYGLGLSIVQHILKLFGSALQIESTEGIGSRFYFDLELKHRLNEQVKKHHSAKTEVSNEFDIEMLIIEDDLQIIDLYRHTFEALDYKLTICRNYDELVAVVNTFDICITDYRLGNADVTHFENLIYSKLHEEAILFVITAKAKSEIALTGDFVFLQKPVSSNYLRELISGSLKELHYGMPIFDSISDDYDNDNVKVSNALNLLYDEWRVLSDKLSSAINDNDSKEAADIIHKIITSVRRIKLDKFETLLIEIQNGTRSLNGSLASEVLLRMQYYLEHIRKAIDY